jgi:hypothetical protein
MTPTTTPTTTPTPTTTTKQTVSYSGHTKTAVFAQWQKHLQQQEFEACCHWTAEIDCSDWQAALWEKAIVYASKNVHLHCPLLPTLLCHHVHAFDGYTGAKAPNAVSQFRVNLCQMMGLLCLSARSPAAALPKVDATKVDSSSLSTSPHSVVERNVRTDDSPVATRILTTLFHCVDDTSFNAAAQMLYWLSVMIECDKHAVRTKMPLLMGYRSPSTTKQTTLLCNTVDRKYGHDWVWLVWDVICDMASDRVHADSGKAIVALRYLFARQYTPGKRNGRMPLVVHALLLLRAGKQVQNTGTIYGNETIKTMVTVACRNIDVMYTELHETVPHRVAHETSNALVQSVIHPPKEPPHPPHPPTKQQLHAETVSRRRKPKPTDIPESSLTKWNALEHIDNMLLGHK